MSLPLTKQDLFSLERYEQQRAAWQAKLRTHKQQRRVHIGPHVTLYFEDRLTMWYQIQEMLRAEKIFDQAGIQEELDTYNPLIPSGQNWKATMMIEYEDVSVRQQQLQALVGIENKVWAQVDQQRKIYAIADEDLERSSPDRTSAVHFIRLQVPQDIRESLSPTTQIIFGIDHPGYQYQIEKLNHQTQASLLNDMS